MGALYGAKIVQSDQVTQDGRLPRRPLSYLRALPLRTRWNRSLSHSEGTLTGASRFIRAGDGMGGPHFRLHPAASFRSLLPSSLSVFNQRHPMPSPQVVVVGSYVQDLCFYCESFPRPGETLMATSQAGPGGKGSNQAVAAGRAGAPTLYVGAIGADAFGRDAKAFYKAEGIAAKWAVKQTQPTGSAAIMVNAEGQNEILVCLAANARLAKADLPIKAIREAEIVITQLEANLTAAAAALKMARENDALTILNPAPMRPDFKPAILKHVDILIPNETEFVELINRLRSDDEPPLTEAALLKLPPSQLHQLCGTFGVPVVIITLGQKGCFISRADGYLTVPAFKVKPVDTTGAGDAFVGGFAAGLLENDGDLAAAVRHGCAVAALSVTKPGTARSMPQASAVKRFLQKHS